MYHRIADLETDSWDLAVSPANFEQQLQLLKQEANVVPLPQLVEGIHNNKLRKNSVAITFDDGYLDNFLVANPLLEKYNLPATFFICSGNIGKEQEFWWDELEHILLFTKQLPAVFCMQVAGKLIEADLMQEIILEEHLYQQHKKWKAFVSDTISARANLFLEVWQQLKPLPYPAQLSYLSKIREWAGIESSVRKDYKSMSINQLRELGKSQLITIGAHTVTHPALAFHDAAFQKREITENKFFLEEVTGTSVNLLAYPYGSYNGFSMDEAYQNGFQAAFTTEEEAVKAGDHPYSFGRFQVKNLASEAFQQQLQLWMNM